MTIPKPASSPDTDLPRPQLPRWQPLRLGLVNLFYYDSEEFHFRDGHLLLRGNNGTGKSKVLSLTLPFLFDAHIRPSRIEPDGDNSKRMAWNLLLGQHERRMGYTWVEFGRLDEDGQPRYLTLGCGLSAVAGRSAVDAWYFLLPDARLSRDLWLMSPGRTVLTRDRLDEALQSLGGQLFRAARDYRRAVDEQLFQLGQIRYEALMDTLVQLRQPQLSRKPDESSLSQALTEALPPIAHELLADVADALTQLEEYRRELQEYEALEQAVNQFNLRYQRYAATQARRQAGEVRRAQTGFDKASRALNDQREALRTALADETTAEAQAQAAESQVNACRTRLDTLRADPAMADAERLEEARQASRQRQADHARAQENARSSRTQLAHEAHESQRRQQQRDQAQQALDETRVQTADAAAEAGLQAAWRNSPLSAIEAAPCDAGQLDATRDELLSAGALRDAQIQAVLQRCQAVDQAARQQRDARIRHDERQDGLQEAAARRKEADDAVETGSRQHLADWSRYLDSLQQLRVNDDDAVLQALETWTLAPEGEHPARLSLLQAQQVTAEHLARQQADLQTRQDALLQEQHALKNEAATLTSGTDPAPLPPPWRDTTPRESLPGAPFWQLVDFRPGRPDAHCAGLEAALQAAGLLDAWVTPDGHLLDAQGRAVVRDAWWQPRPQATAALGDWLIPARTEDLPPQPGVRQAALQVPVLLSSIACGSQDDPAAEAWVSPEGRFRLGPLAGCWQKSRAEHIGQAARAAARQRRLEEIQQCLSTIDADLQALTQQADRIRHAQQQAIEEWRAAPSDEALRTAHIQASTRAQEYAQAQTYLQLAAAQLRQADETLAQAQQALTQDAEDLHLPPSASALNAIEHHVRDFAVLVPQCLAAHRTWHQTVIEWHQQSAREAAAQAHSRAANEQAAECAHLAEQARVRLDTLQGSIGIQVRELQQRLQAAHDALLQAEQAHRQWGAALRQAAEARIRTEQRTETATALLEQGVATRLQAVARLQGFAATGLLAAALPDLVLPPADAWTLDAALSLARHCEQTLSDTQDDEAAWNRIQNEISRDYTELGRALTTLSHQAQAETTDFGLVVHIIYRNRPERPGQLDAQLKAEIAQRRALLSAREREVLETHLQAEIASAIQRRLLEAEYQIRAINAELQQRPTTTGVRFRLRWEPLPEGADGAPVGLEAARRHLLNTSTDLWTAEDRRVVGEMLQQRIEAERSRSELLPGSGLLDQLSRALDYRRWHRFRVERWDGRWQPLSGPASSGERALGLTVPLFAAVSSFYAQSQSAPRLVLLDEVFAGIDDDARAHCWALIREFDLDFVVTSEREWACSAELPGVAIAQLQRREGIQAVHVSRWVWDGRTRRREADPDGRFPPTGDAAPIDPLLNSSTDDAQG